MKAGIPLELCGVDWIVVEGTLEMGLLGAEFCNLVIVRSFRILPDPLAFRLLLCCAEGADGDA